MKVTKKQLRNIIREAINIDLSGHKPKIDNLMRMEPAAAKALVSALQDPGLEARWAYRIIQRVEEINERIGELEKLGVHYTGYGTVHGAKEQHDEMMNLMDEFDELVSMAGSYEKQFNKQASRDRSHHDRRVRMSESVSRNEVQKIEQLWWNQDQDSGEYPERDMALALINSIGLDPKSLRLWSIIFPWGEAYEPWTFYGGAGEDPGFTSDEINRILDYYNSNSSPQLELFVKWDPDSGWAELESTNDDFLEPDPMETMNTIEDLIEKARFETAQ
tara:strand:- start:17 stop:841 length:825 start_codon:yes stop_codon:yes gene_type:complete